MIMKVTIINTVKLVWDVFTQDLLGSAPSVLD